MSSAGGAYDDLFAPRTEGERESRLGRGGLGVEGAAGVAGAGGQDDMSLLAADIQSMVSGLRDQIGGPTGEGSALGLAAGNDEIDLEEALQEYESVSNDLDAINGVLEALEQQSSDVQAMVSDLLTPCPIDAGGGTTDGGGSAAALAGSGDGENTAGQAAATSGDQDADAGVGAPTETQTGPFTVKVDRTDHSPSSGANG